MTATMFPTDVDSRLRTLRQHDRPEVAAIAQALTDARRASGRLAAYFLATAGTRRRVLALRAKRSGEQLATLPDITPPF